MGKKKNTVSSRAKVPPASKKKRQRKQEKRKPVLPTPADHATPSAGYSVDDYMTKVEEYLDSFQLEMAVKFCERALQLEPDNLYVLDTMAPLLLEAGQPDRALELWQQAVSLSPDEGHTKYLYLGQMTQGQDAIGHLTKGIELMTRGKGAESVGGACTGGDEDLKEQLSNAYCALAEVYLTDNCFSADAGERCYECCCKAVELLPGNPEGHQLMASCLLSQQLPDKALEALLKGLSLWLPSRHGDSKGGGATAAAGMTDEESDCIPSYASRVGVAKLLLELEDYDLAFEVLEGLLQEDDEVVGVWYLMGWLHYLLKDADSARFYLEQTRALYAKLCCDEEEMLAHATEILAELGPAPCALEEKGPTPSTLGEEGHTPCAPEEEGHAPCAVGEEEVGSGESDNDMDVS